MKRTQPLSLPPSVIRCASVMGRYVCVAGLIGVLGSAAFTCEAKADQPDLTDQSAESTFIPAPEFVSYDDSLRVLTGYAQPGYVVRAFDENWNIAGEARSDESGLFSMGISDLVELSSLSVYVLDDSGAILSEPLGGAQILEAIDAQTYEAYRVAAGSSTTQIVQGIADSLDASGLASQLDETSTETLPIVPYAMGAISALLGVGIVAGVWALLKQRRTRPRATFGASPGSVDFNGADEPAYLVESGDVSAAPRHSAIEPPYGSTESDESSEYRCGAHAYVEDTDISPVESVDSVPDDPLEDFALRYTCDFPVSVPGSSEPDDDPHGGSSTNIDEIESEEEDCPDELYDKSEAPNCSDAVSDFALSDSPEVSGANQTMPFDLDVLRAPSDVSDFSRRAKILAHGLGGVHRVDTPRSHLDYSGIDSYGTVDSSDETVCAVDPFLADNDVYTLALSELTRDENYLKTSQNYSTEEFISSVLTRSYERLAAPSPHVAPVIGPGVDRAAAARRQNALRASDAAPALYLKERDDEFLARRPLQSMQQVQPAQPVPRPAPVSQQLRAPKEAKKRYEAEITRDGVPIIARAPGQPGPAASYVPISGKRDVTYQSHGVPDPASFVPSRPASSTPIVSDRGLSAAVSAANAAYAAFSTYTTQFNAPVSTARPTMSQSDLATSYARAVYGPIEQSITPPVPERQQAASISTIPDVTKQDRSNGMYANPYEYWDRDYEYAYQTFSPAYIDYMVRDEFAHRHETAAQRNAALGRIHVVNGTANTQSSLRDSRRRSQM